MDCRTPGLPVPHHLPKFAQVHVHCIGDTIQPSHPLMPSSPSALNFYQGFPMSQLSLSNDQNTGLSVSVLPMSIQRWFPLRSTGLVSLQSKGLSGVLSAPQFESIHSLALHLLYGPALTTIHDHFEDHSPDYTDLCLQSNVPAFQCTVLVCRNFPAKKQVSSDFMSSVTIQSDFGAQEEGICHYFHLFPSIWHEVMEPDTSILVYLIFNFKLALSLSPLTLIKRLISSSLLSAIKVISSAYLRLLMFLPPIFITARHSSSLAFLMICSGYRLSKQVTSRQPCSTPFSILNPSVVPYRILNVASWPTCWFLRRQVRWSGIPTYLRAFHSLLWWIRNATPWWHYSLGFWIVLLEFYCIH